MKLNTQALCTSRFQCEQNYTFTETRLPSLSPWGSTGSQPVSLSDTVSVFVSHSCTRDTHSAEQSGFPRPGSRRASRSPAPARLLPGPEHLPRRTRYPPRAMPSPSPASFQPRRTKRKPKANLSPPSRTQLECGWLVASDPKIRFHRSIPDRRGRSRRRARRSGEQSVTVTDAPAGQRGLEARLKCV